MAKKKITLIYPFAYGYIDFVIDELQSYQNVEVTDIKTDLIKYIYPNVFKRLENMVSKPFGRNLKKIYFKDEIFNKIVGEQDIIFIIRPDLLDDSILNELKTKTKKLVAYYYDSCEKYPKQVEIIPLFDEIFSYEKDDIKKFGFSEASNFIYDNDISEEPIKYDIFNVSSYDSRIDEIDKISRELADFGFAIHFVLFWYEKLNYPHLISTTSYLSLSETKKLIAQSKAMIDIQRIDQKGLSFRTFESLGYQKKLITTNDAILKCDFYHPNNMMVIEKDQLNLKEIQEFLELPYQEISEEIIEKYNVKTFVKNIFKV